MGGEPFDVFSGHLVASAAPLHDVMLGVISKARQPAAL
jgi:hypothetical protein